MRLSGALARSARSRGRERRACAGVRTRDDSRHRREYFYPEQMEAFRAAAPLHSPSRRTHVRARDREGRPAVRGRAGSHRARVRRALRGLLVRPHAAGYDVCRRRPAPADRSSSRAATGNISTRDGARPARPRSATGRTCWPWPFAGSSISGPRSRCGAHAVADQLAPIDTCWLGAWTTRRACDRSPPAEISTDRSARSSIERPGGARRRRALRGEA